MNQYYKCTVKVQTEDDNGKIKNRKEEYIVSAVGPTDVEEKINKRLEGLDFEISSVNLTKIIEIIE